MASQALHIGETLVRTGRSWKFGGVVARFLGYLDAERSAWNPLNTTTAERDLIWLPGHGAGARRRQE
jgi:hypothetical protein